STPRYQRSAQNIIGEDKPPPARPTLKNKRVWASVRQDAESVIRSVFEEATRSGDFQEYWHFHKLQEFQRNHLRYYQDPQRILAV
ncbi:hypothetical protein HC928_06355, partial [bacterium]|nr:hypothetical protein [bacterium]